MIVTSREQWRQFQERVRSQPGPPHVVYSEPYFYPCFASYVGAFDNPSGPYEDEYAFFYVDDARALLDSVSDAKHATQEEGQ